MAHWSQELDASATQADGYVYTDVVKQWYYQIELTDLTVDGQSVVKDCYEVR